MLLGLSWIIHEFVNWHYPTHQLSLQLFIESVVAFATLVHAVSTHRYRKSLSNSPAANILNNLYLDGSLYYFVSITSARCSSSCHCSTYLLLLSSYSHYMFIAPTHRSCTYFWFGWSHLLCLHTGYPLYSNRHYCYRKSLMCMIYCHVFDLTF
jgi:hypothetical protein